MEVKEEHLDLQRKEGSILQIAIVKFVNRCLERAQIMEAKQRLS